LITPNEVKHVERERWPQTSIQSVMRPLSQLRVVTPETPIVEALQMMGRDDINQLPVVSGGQLQGIFSRGSIMGFLRTHAELFKH